MKYAYLTLFFLAVVTVSLLGIRQQSLVGDEQFLRSMIPHHSGAILMCEENRLKDPELTRLCLDIITSQKQEIAQMKQLLAN